MTTYLVHGSDHATSAAHAARSFLESRPIEHNLVLSILRDRIARPEPGRYWWITENGAVRGVALRSPATAPALVTPMPVEAVGPLVDAMAAAVPDLGGISGEAATAAAFAGAWTERRGAAARPLEALRIYRADAFRVPEAVPGRLRVATPGDVDLVAAWFVAFKGEVDGQDPTIDEARPFIVDEVARGGFWLWEHGGEVVAAVLISIPIVGVARIPFVFTPAERRGSGFAAAAVAALGTAALGDDQPLGRVRSCMLYAQLHNATSNRVYRRIGFRAVAESLAYELLGA